VVGVHRVVLGTHHQGGHLDPVEVRGAVPVEEDAAETELARTLHRHVDVGVDVGERPHHRVGPLRDRHPAHVVAVVVLEKQRFVRRVVGCARRLQPLDLGESGLVHGRHQDVLGVGVVRAPAGHHVGDHQALEVLLVRQRVLHRQHPAPRLPDHHEVVRVEPEREAHLLDLADEPVDRPQRRVVGLVAVVGAELVVVVVLDPGRG
jgi:hypothetical protein